jgi:hypothetical protein
MKAAMVWNYRRWTRGHTGKAQFTRILPCHSALGQPFLSQEGSQSRTAVHWIRHDGSMDVSVHEMPGKVHGA